MRVLGVDLGLKRSGLALSDESGISVRLLGNMNARNQQQAVDEICKLVDEYFICAIVIGQPQSLSKESEAICRRAQSLAAALHHCFSQRDEANTPDIVLWDESNSSRKAMSHLVMSGVPQKKRREKLDSASAAVLVEEYIYWRTNQKK